MNLRPFLLVSVQGAEVLNIHIQHLPLIQNEENMHEMLPR